MSLRAARYVAEYGLYLAFLGAVRALPHRAARRFGELLGSLTHAFDLRHRRVADANLRAALPELAEGERRRLVRRCYRHIGGMACDALSMTRFGPEALCRRYTLVGWEHLLEAERAGRGVFLMTAHLGSWEMLGYPVVLYRGPGHFIARPADNRLLERAVRRMRERFGNVGVPRRGAGLAMLSALRRGARVYILADQRVGRHEGIEVPFLGRPATTSTMTATLSLLSRSPVVPLFCYPEPGGRFRVEVHPAIHPEGSGQQAVAALTRRYVAVTEAEIRRHPEMWLWMHDRWRQRAEAGR